MLAVVLWRSHTKSTAPNLPLGPSSVFSSWARLTSYGVASVTGELGREREGEGYRESKREGRQRKREWEREKERVNECTYEKIGASPWHGRMQTTHLFW